MNREFIDKYVFKDSKPRLTAVKKGTIDEDLFERIWDAFDEFNPSKYPWNYNIASFCALRGILKEYAERKKGSK